MQEAVYKGLLKEQRRHLHARAAWALEQAGRDGTKKWQASSATAGRRWSTWDAGAWNWPAVSATGATSCRCSSGGCSIFTGWGAGTTPWPWRPRRPAPSPTSPNRWSTWYLCTSRVGETDRAAALLADLAEAATSENSQLKASYAWAHAGLLLAQGRPADALAVLEPVLALGPKLGLTSTHFKQVLVAALEACECRKCRPGVLNWDDSYRMPSV